MRLSSIVACRLRTLCCAAAARLDAYSAHEGGGNIQRVGTGSDGHRQHRYQSWLSDDG